MRINLKKMDKLKTTSIAVIAIMISTKIISLIRDFKITAILGASAESDAYNIAYLLSITVFGFISSAYVNSIMPVASELYISDRKKLQKTINNILSISTIVILIVIFVCWIFPEIFVSLFTSSAIEETYNLALKVSKISIISLLFLVYISVFSVLLRIYDRNIIPAIGEMIFPIPILICLYLGVNSIYLLVLLIVIGYFFQSLIQIIYLKKEHFKFYFYIDFKDKYFIKIVSLMPPMLISSGLLQINQILNNRIASEFGAGNITSMSLAIKINGLAYTIFATSLMQIIYSSISKAYVQGNMDKFQKILKKQVITIMMLILPCAICMIVFNEEIVRLLFVRGNFTEEAGKVTASILLGYSVGLIFYVLRDVCNYVLYSSKNTKIPAIISGISIIINMFLAVFLSNIIGIQGISYATSIAGGCSLIMLIFYIRKKMNKIALMDAFEIVKFIISGLSMFVLIVILKKCLPEKIIFYFIIIVIGTITFWIIYYVMANLYSVIEKNK